MREYRCDTERIKRMYKDIAVAVSEAIQYKDINVYDKIQLVVIDDVVTDWYGPDAFTGKRPVPPADSLAREFYEARYEYEKRFFEESSTSHAVSLALLKGTVEATEQDMLAHVLTDSEAARLWGVGLTAVIRACQSGKGDEHSFRPTECRDSMGTWLVTEAAMNRVFGKRRSMYDGERPYLTDMAVEEAGALLRRLSPDEYMPLLKKACDDLENGKEKQLVDDLAALGAITGVALQTVTYLRDNFEANSKLFWDFLEVLVTADETRRAEGAMWDGVSLQLLRVAPTVTTPTTDNELLDAYDEAVLDEHGFRAEVKERQGQHYDDGKVDEQGLTDDISYEELMSKVVDSDLSDLIKK